MKVGANKRRLMLTCLTATLILVHASAAFTTWAQPLDPPAYVYLTWARDDTARSINVSWRTLEQGYLGEVRYDTEPRGGNPELYHHRAVGDPASTPLTFEGLRGYLHHVELIGLEPDTVYYFITGHPDYGWSGERAFRTAPAKRASFRFVVGADSNRLPMDWPKIRDVSRLMAQYNPSFVLFAGDLVEIWRDQGEWDSWFSTVDLNWVSGEGLTIPIIPSIGNHDVGATGDYDPMRDAPNYYGHFRLPGNEQWYALSWGPDLRIIVLDSEVMGGAAWKEQLGWLEGELSASKDNLWKVAIFHRDMVSSRGPAQRMIYDLGFLFDKYRVNLVFQGHAHFFERSHPLDWTRSPEKPMESPEKGTIYMVGGSWGGRPGSAREPQWFSAFGPVPEHGFLLVDVFENGALHMRAIDLENNVLDELIIQKEVPELAEEVPEAEVPIATLAVAALAAVGTIFLFLKLRRRRGKIAR